MANIINVARLFPIFVNDDESEELTTLVMARELEGMMKWFKRDKGLRPDGWTIEFYLA